VTNAVTGINLSADIFRAKYGPLAWPTSLGNVVRENRIARARGVGIRTGKRGRTDVPSDGAERGFALVGNVIEDNEVQDAPTWYGGDDFGMAIAFRKNAGGGPNKANEKPRFLVKPSNAANWLIDKNSFEAR
jgi:hypothetical protein